VQLDLPDGNRLHLINVHLKSQIPTDIPGPEDRRLHLASADAWAEGSFISSMKRMSQALEVRRLIDRILDTDPAQIVVAGDFNATPR
jgi:endonuclease/exonuclease/phosphatase (EEP) superfamily protein YafD